MTDRERTYILLKQVYKQIPGNLQEAVTRASWFLQGGTSPDTEEKQDVKRLYSFDKDDKLIFSAFLQTHGVNLRTASLHWWEFLALFADLGSETGFSQLVHLRYLVKNNLATSDDIARANQLGDAFLIDDESGLDKLTKEESANVEAFWREWNKETVK